MKFKAYYDQIDRRVLDVINQGADFKKIITNSGGIFPTDVVDSLHRLSVNGMIPISLYEKIIRESRIVAMDGKKSYVNDVVPHLLDGDWRFSSSGLEKLHKRIESIYNKKKRDIMFIGTPTAFIYYLVSTNSDGRVCLLDKNAARYNDIVKQHKKDVVCYSCNLPEDFDSSETGRYSIVVMDPPWYMEPTKAFLWTASQACIVGGYVICVIPPIYTRPGIQEERQQLLAYCRKCGLEYVSIDNNAVSYSTPPYEINSLRANGIYCSLDEWRVGDVMILRKSKEISIKHNQVLSEVFEEWDEFNYGAVRIKYRKRNGNVASNIIELSSPWADDIYPTVSRRFQHNYDINVWTSGNRAFHCNNMTLFEWLLKHIDENFVSEDIPGDNSNLDIASLERCRKKILSVIWQELKEYGLKSEGEEC